MSQTPEFDATLLERYDRPGPRYTSYPTVPQFTAAFTERDFIEFARRSNAGPAPRPLSLYAHIPYCSSPCFYCGCNRLIALDPLKGVKYVRSLLREIGLVAPLFDTRREVVQLHLGGGTPNFLNWAQIGALVRTLRATFNLSERDDRDFSIELDPRFIAPDDIQHLADIGFNRASLGVQDFAPDVQRAINRIQHAEPTLDLIRACRDSGMRSVNVDLIYGLPRQTLAGFELTLNTLLEVRPERFAIYGYAHMPQLFKAQRQIKSAELPDAATRLALLGLAIERLTAAGYRYIGMDHFALPTDDLSRAQAGGQLHRNFMGYTTHADCDLVGLGMSAISHIGASFSQNARGLYDWEAALNREQLPVWRGMKLDRDDLIRADVIQQLMCQGQLNMAAIERRHGIDFAAYFAADLQRLQPMLADGLVDFAGDYIIATPRGRFLLRTIAMCFDRYLQSAHEQPRFSKMV